MNELTFEYNRENCKRDCSVKYDHSNCGHKYAELESTAVSLEVRLSSEVLALKQNLADANKKVAELELESYIGTQYKEQLGHCETALEERDERLTEERAKAEELDQFLTDACNERDEYAKRAEEAEAENKRLAARDCNATVQLCTPTEEQAKREDLEKRVKAVHRLYEMQVQAAVKLTERLSTSEAVCQVLAERVMSECLLYKYVQSAATINEIINQAREQVKGAEKVRKYGNLESSLTKANDDFKAIGKLIHWPECWDTSVYPTILAALEEYFGCEPFCCNGYECEDK